MILILIYSIAPVHCAHFGGFNHIGLFHSIGSDELGFDEVIINPTNGTIADALKISDHVLLMPGNYTGEGNTNINVSRNKHIRAIDPDTVVIDGARKNRLFNVEKNSILNLTNLVLTGGSDNEGNGGEIFSNGSLNIKGSIIQGNSADMGGGIYINVDNTFNFVNTKIINNSGRRGGGVYIDGSNGIVKNSTFENNGNIDPNKLVVGSGLFINGDANVNMNNSSFNGNKGGFGGGLVIQGLQEDIKKSKISINNSVLQDNEEIASGAGMSCTYAYVSILNSKFYNNKIDKTYDIYNFSNGAGVYTTNCELNIKNSEFRNNSGLYGSGLCNENGTNTTIENCSFVDNVARGYGAGMVVLDGNLDVKNTNFMNNTANVDTSTDDHNGGGIYLFNGNINVDNSTFKNNHAHHGGGLDTRFASVNIKNSLFDGNSAVYGGGLYSREGNINLESSVLSNNSVGMNGGGVYNLNGSATIDNCNISSNVAVDNGGGLNARYGSYNIKNSLISHNTGKDGAGAYVHFGNLNITSSNVSDNSGEYGAGLCCEDRNLNLLSSNISSNRASLNAAGSYNINGTVTIDNSTFESNVAGDNGGGLDTRHGNSYVVNSKFIRNNASRGGAFYTRDGNVNIENTVLSDNVAGSGGAIYNGALLNVVNSNFTSNRATTGGYYYGGGGAIKNLGILTINASNFNSNQAKSSVNSGEVNRGGAIAASNDIEITGSKFIANKADSVNSQGGGDGSGGAIKTWNKCKFLVKDSLFDSNFASYRGGAIDFDDSISREGRSTDAVAQGTNLDANLVNVNFNNNNANVGGAVELCNGIVSATGVKFTGNSASVQGGALDIRGVDYSSSFNILDANGKHFSDFFKDNSAPLGKSVLIYMGQYLNPGFICDEGVNSREVLKDFYSTWK